MAAPGSLNSRPRASTPAPTRLAIAAADPPIPGSSGRVPVTTGSSAHVAYRTHGRIITRKTIVEAKATMIPRRRSRELTRTSATTPTISPAAYHDISDAAAMQTTASRYSFLCRKNSAVITRRKNSPMPLPEAAHPSNHAWLVMTTVAHKANIRSPATSTASR